MVKKNSVLLEKQICPKNDDYESDEYEEEIIEKKKPKSKKQILPKNDNNENNDQEELIKQLVDQMAQKKLKEQEIKPKGKRGPKYPLNDKHLESLKNGREKLKQKWEDDKILKKELTEKYAVKLANKKIKNELIIKHKMGLNDDDDNDSEEPIKIIQPKKPKKKKTIILEPESDSEEEIIIKKNNKKKVEKSEPIIEKLPTKKIIFF
jgi:hypothetical protein